MFFSDWSNLVHTLTIGVLAYAALIVLLRVSGKRTLSKWNAFDLVITVSFGSMLASGLLSKQASLAQVVLGFAVLVCLQFVVTWLSVRSRMFEGWIKARPTLLLHRGEMLKDAMLRCRVPEGEVLAALRSNGIGNLEEAAAVVLETDGQFSVIKRSLEGPSSTLADVARTPERLRRA